MNYTRRLNGIALLAGPPGLLLRVRHRVGPAACGWPSDGGLWRTIATPLFLTPSTLRLYD